MTICANTITISRGSDWSVSLSFKDEVDVPIDYSGASLSAEILFNADDSVIAMPISVWTDALVGEASLALNEAETLAMPVGPVCRLRITTVTSGGTTKIWPSALVEVCNE